MYPSNPISLAANLWKDNKRLYEKMKKDISRHYIAVLIQANRYRRDRHVPSIYRMPDHTELGKAIDFAVETIKKYCEL